MCNTLNSKIFSKIVHLVTSQKNKSIQSSEHQKPLKTSEHHEHFHSLNENNYSIIHNVRNSPFLYQTLPTKIFTTHNCNFTIHDNDFYN